MPSLPHVLAYHPRPPQSDKDIDVGRLTELRRVAAFWKVPQSSKLPRQDLVRALRQAMRDDRTLTAVVAGLNSQDREVLAAYHRYGDTVNGAVIRLDLMARGLLRKVEQGTRAYSWSRWQRDPIHYLAERGVLVRPDGTLSSDGWSGYNRNTESAFPTYALLPAVSRHVEPAGPPPWHLSPLPGSPTSLGARPLGQVVLDLSRVCTFVGTRVLRVNKSGELSTPALRALAKAVPLVEDPDFPLPDPHGLAFELLRSVGVVRVEDDQALADPVAATRLFSLPAAAQAHALVQAWLRSKDWADGQGLIGTDSSRETFRAILTWALASLAHQGDVWFDLTAFVGRLHDDIGRYPDYLGYDWREYAWNPGFVAAQGKEKKQGKEREQAYWFAGTGSRFANALMVTLAALGLIERGRSAGKEGALCFRLTPLGRAVFGAPEIQAEAAPPGRFLVVQPNFDVLAYLDQADPGVVGLLGRFLETGPTSGPVQQLRLTQGSLYQGLEGGMTLSQVEELLQRHSQREVPANVLQTLADWSARRESLVLQSGVTLLGFATPAQRDDYLAGNAGRPCGDRFVILPPQTRRQFPYPPRALVIDHAIGGRRTLQVDEYGQVRTRGPLDTVQRARLQRFADLTPAGWQLTAASVARAAAAGHKPGLIRLWLGHHLAGPLPPLLGQALNAWAGKAPALELAQTLLLHVPDEALFHAVASSPRLRPLLRGSPGPGWLAVRAEAGEELKAVLAELGFTIGDRLTYEDLPPPNREE